MVLGEVVADGQVGAWVGVAVAVELVHQAGQGATVSGGVGRVVGLGLTLQARVVRQARPQHLSLPSPDQGNHRVEAQQRHRGVQQRRHRPDTRVARKFQDLQAFVTVTIVDRTDLARNLP